MPFLESRRRADATGQVWACPGAKAATRTLRAGGHGPQPPLTSTGSVGQACESGAKPPPAPARQRDLLVDATLRSAAALGEGQVMRPPERILYTNELPGRLAKPLEPVPNPSRRAPKSMHLAHAMPVRFFSEQASYELANSSLGLSLGDRWHRRELAHQLEHATAFERIDQVLLGLRPSVTHARAAGLQVEISNEPSAGPEPPQLGRQLSLLDHPGPDAEPRASHPQHMHRFHRGALDDVSSGLTQPLETRLGGYGRHACDSMARRYGAVNSLRARERVPT